LSNAAPEEDYSDFVGTFDFNSAEVKAPIWPIIVSGVLLGLSVALIAIERTTDGTTLLVFAFLGYALTPLSTAAMLIVAMRSNMKLSSVAGYRDSSGKKLIKSCAMVAWAGFVVAIPHVWFIADYFSLVFAPGSSS